MTGDLAPLRGLHWPALSHHFARAFLEHTGWSRCGQGDWAYVYRSPAGYLAARLSPFEPGWRYFVDLCARLPDNRYLPRHHLATPLEGGGQLTVLDYLHEPGPDTVQRFLQAWADPVHEDEDLRALRRGVEALDAWGRENVRWWVGIDLGERHVLAAPDGAPKVIDLFGLSSTFLQDLVDDPVDFAREIPAGERRYLLDMPDLQAADHPASYLSAIRTALGRCR